MRARNEIIFSKNREVWFSNHEERKGNFRIFWDLATFNERSMI